VRVGAYPRRKPGSPSGRSATLAKGRDDLRECDAWNVSELVDLRDQMRAFTEQRDWGQFHDPKSLILALTGEMGELAELFQWLPAADAADRAGNEPLKSRVGQELADILIYLVRLADVLGVDLGAAAREKLSAAGDRFPAKDVFGHAPVKS
jgi:dCTP diphosphatase